MLVSLNMIFLSIVYNKQHTTNQAKNLLAGSASEAQGVVLETITKVSEGEGATTYTYFVSFQVLFSSKICSSLPFQPPNLIFH